MRTMKEAASEFLALKRIAVTGVSRKPNGHGSNTVFKRLRERGYANVWTPRAELLHYESASRGPDDSPAKRRRHRLEQALMLARWNKVLRRDPAYNPQLALDGPGFQLAYPPRR